MKQSIAADAVKLTTSKVITMLISMISAMLLSRLRTLEEYGTYSQIMLIINLTTTIFMMGLPNSINYYMARAENQRERERFVSVYYTLSTVLSLFTGLMLVIGTPLIVRYFENNLIRKFVYLLALFPWTRIILSSIDNILIVYRKTNYLMVFRIINSILLLIIIFIVEAFNLGFEMYMFLFLIIEAIFAFSVYVLVGGIVGQIKICLEKELVKKIFKFSIPIGLASVAGTLKNELDKLVIAGFYDTESLAIYANAARELPVTFIASSITAVLMPQVAIMIKNNQKSSAVDLWGNATLLSYAVICFIATGIFTYAPEVISLLYSEKYLPGVPVFRVYSLVLIFRSTYFGMILNCTGKTKVILYSSLLSLLLNTVLNFVFYYLLGFIGPAIATILTILLNALYLLWETAKVTKIGMSKLFPWREIMYIAYLNLFFGFAFMLIKNLVPLDIVYGEIIESIILGLIWGGLYFLIIRKLLISKWNSMKST